MSQTRRLTATVAAVPRIFTALLNCIRPSGCLLVFTTQALDPSVLTPELESV